MDIARVTEKYTSHRIDLQALLAAHRSGHPVATALAQALDHAANAVSETETELTRIIEAINDSTAKVTENITATAGQRVPTLNPLGELQGHAPRFDALIAVRDERIKHLRAVTRIWAARQNLPPNS